MADINVLATPSIRVIGRDASPEALDKHMARLAEEIDARSEVVAAKAELDRAAAALAHLKARHVSLNARAQGLNGRLTGNRDALRQALIATDKDISDSALSKIGNARAEYDGVAEAIAVVARDLIPEAETALKAAKVEHYDSQAAAIADMLNARGGRLIELLSQIAEEEFVVDIDTLDLPVFLSLRTQRSQLLTLASQGRESLKQRREQEPKQ